MCNLFSPQLYESLKHAIKDDIENYEIIPQDENKKCDGFMGKILFITLKHKVNHKEFHLIFKEAFTDQQLRCAVPVKDAFTNEISFYTKIFPALSKLQEKIDTKYQLNSVPKCFASIPDENRENLILENLKVQNFELYDKKKPLDKEHFELVLRELGKFHALSFVYKSLHPEEYKNLTSNLVNIYSELTKKDYYIKSVKYLGGICLKNLEPGRDNDLIKKLKPIVENTEEVLTDALLNKTKYTVIAHGDFWTSNMMFKYDENKKVVDMRTFDFQAIRDASPVFDLAHCIFTGASREILENLDYYLQAYHSSLSATIRYLGCDSEKLYPIEQLKKDLKLHSMFGFITGLIMWKVKLTDEEKLLDFTDMEDGQEEIIKQSYDEGAYDKITRDLIHFYANDLNFN